MKIFSLERLKNIKLIDLLSPKIVRYIWNAELDARVCPLCESLHGKIMDVNDSDFMTYQPPLHTKCRCHFLPLTSDVDKIPEVTWTTPIKDWVTKYAPFIFLIPDKEKKKKDEIIPIELPYIPEAPELVFNPNDVLSIEEFIRETEFRREEGAYE